MGHRYVPHRYVGPIVQETLLEFTCQVKSNIALCEGVQESGECDDYQGMVNNLEHFKKDYTKRIKNIDRQIQAAVESN